MTLPGIEEVLVPAPGFSEYALAAQAQGLSVLAYSMIPMAADGEVESVNESHHYLGVLHRINRLPILPFLMKI
mgnify:CR=1 FL=1